MSLEQIASMVLAHRHKEGSKCRGIPVFHVSLKGTQHIPRNIVVIWVNIFQTEEITEIQLVRPTEVCGKV